MRWSPLEVVTPPTGELTLADVRAFVGLKSDNVARNSLLDTIRRAVVADAEYWLRRAVFAQRRRFTAWGDHDGEGVRQGFNVEPLENLTVTLNDAVVQFSIRYNFVALERPWRIKRDDALTITYDAGYPPGALPPDLQSALLAECQRRYERAVVPAGGADGAKAPEKLDIAGSLARYRAYHEPLVASHVEGWGPR